MSKSNSIQVPEWFKSYIWRKAEQDQELERLKLIYQNGKMLLQNAPQRGVTMAGLMAH